MSRRLAELAAGWLDSRFSRRGFLWRAAVVGSALAVDPVNYLLRPVSATTTACGTDTQCSDGYTVLCCTINNGVNVCPSGTFAGGWWKADYASLCGGNARYYIDCQADCSHCTTGCNPFCTSNCWSCSCRCETSSSTCDHRRVCCNVFRYGQCNQHIACGGPVVCRQISCVPPYRWLSCTTTSATDDNTTSHTAPCQPGWNAILQHYDTLGGGGSFLKASVNANYPAAGGLEQVFQGGRIWWSSATGAHEAHGLILERFLAIGGVTYSPLGFPTTDETPVGPNDAGRANWFQHGGIYWSIQTGAHSVNNEISYHYRILGGAMSVLGYPASEPGKVGDALGGEYSRFQHGSIYYSSKTNAYAVEGSVDTRYQQLGGPKSLLGYPSDDTQSVGDTAGGRYNLFQYGAMYWSSSTGAHLLQTDMQAKYSALSGPKGVLGYPTSDEAATADGKGSFADFQQGAIYSSTASGVHEVHGQIYTAWVGAGGEAGQLGFPVSDVYALSDGDEECDFQGGNIVYDPTTGTVTITYT